MSPSDHVSAEADPSRPSLEDAIINPGAVKINVQGAYIVDDQPPTPDSIPDGDGVHYERKDIRLPHHTSVVSHVAVDVSVSQTNLPRNGSPQGAQCTDNGVPPRIYRSEEGGRLNFMSFETERIDRCIDFIQQLKQDHERLNGSVPDELCVIATGGGAYKYYDRLKQTLNVDIMREEEMDCLITGLDFFINEIPNEVFSYSETEHMQFTEPRAGAYPYLLVNIGSGVSMIKVSGPNEFLRVGGTHLGGGTFWGILSLLTGATTFDDMLAMADRGDNSGVDMLVGDIYGMDYTKIGLKSTAIASSFGKVFKMKRAAERQAVDAGEDAQNAPGAQFSPEDMSRSLLFAISNNIGQIAYLQSEKHGLKHIYFGGSFIRGHRQTMNTLSYAIKFWSKGEKEAYFLRHEGYLGAVGAFLKRQPQNWGRRNSMEDSSLSKQARDDLRQEVQNQQQK
ncbi:type II pantothenate kinase [Talaromyces islandicus]|uniref:Type II pantothenate kinase n=1 Tax=Talaromyces islandicus TaxID=28573 RepID=A0A0U1LIH0_TALIS|nr:type II pantothenate kinase [Talaromyces islandicus]